MTDSPTANDRTITVSDETYQIITGALRILGEAGTYEDAVYLTEEDAQACREAHRELEQDTEADTLVIEQ